MMKFEVVIVGGGPAGLSAGFAFANIGLSVALIEKDSYPRDKTCAGILTQKTIFFLKEKIPSLNINQFLSTPQLTLFYKNEHDVHVPIKEPFTLVDRTQFDFELSNICKESGVHILESKKVTNIEPNVNILHLNDGQTITYDFLIAADGAHSNMRRLLGIPRMPLAFCIQDSLERRLCRDSLSNLQELQLYFGNVTFGYSWIVPNNENILIGTGVFMNNFNWLQLQEKHNELCSMFFSPLNISKRRGAHVPIGGLISQTDYPNENIIFIGDAAGLANPLTGEGIYYALFSGFLASQSYSINTKKFKTTYLRLLQDTTNRLEEERNLISSFYESSMMENIFLQFKDYPEYLASICDEVVSLEQRSYLSLITELRELFR